MCCAHVSSCTVAKKVAESGEIAIFMHFTAILTPSAG